ncbi:Killer cell lectin-like receptor 2 [Cricetulus griseus]|uniref:Killer cell lectin-like receptor 2 n=1 Tax=Cricetulus griseus TaxID=10029 RepID=G3I5X3_CRIGR|nr:Killer cell lectin-like receptor 2 [Cricetulus griseus]
MSMASDFYLRYYVGHKGKFGHEFLEFEFRPDVFQYRQEKHDQEKMLKIIQQKYHIMKNESYLKEQIFKNKSTECDDLKDRLNSVNSEWKRCYGETKIVLDCIHHTGKCVEGHWFCCGIKCYYFLMDNKSWNRCKQTCEDCSLSLLKTDDDDELCRQEKHGQENILKKLYQMDYIMKNECNLKEQIFNNKSTECDALKDHLNSVNSEWKRCYGETKIVLDCIQHTGKRVEGHWFCCGIKCYYFIMDNKSWNRCKQTCEDCSLSLLKTDDDDELVP